ncbi:MAG TPA: TauD/TfdA family dioxygenase [Thermoanaerobaculia bacterium]|jgi:alpha-ketoglutarate-dependent taurine dioxygenase|nr:TauD/TfdA family dioxygenase [Thermoanaerobaculia bacterium]
MSEQETSPPSLRKLGIPTRRAVSVSPQDMVRMEPLNESGLPLLVQPSVPGVSLAGWAEANRDLISSQLAKHGGILFRGFAIPQVEEFEHVVRAISGELLEYKERSSPRHAVSGRIYTSTDYPPEYPIFLHNENSYQAVWPRRIFFYCAKALMEGGETPIADVRKLYQRVDPEVRERFIAKRWMVMRNYGDGFGLPWQAVYQTEDKAQVEAHCLKNGIQLEWKDGNRLRTRAVRNAVARHPDSGDLCWFNHATFFHVSTLAPAIRESLIEEFAEEDLPTNTYYGDGSPIEPDVLDHLRSCYHAETISFPWQVGDLLMLDNMMAAHGRAPFKGERQVLVGMSHPTTWADVPPL